MHRNTHGDTPGLDTSKRLAILRARAALAGVTLYATTDDHGQPCYIVSRWNLTRQLDDLDAAEQWLEKVSGVHHG
jgi:hypothetical protein